MESPGAPKYLKIQEETSSGEPVEDPPMPLWRKLCFAVGGIPYQMATNVIGFFLNIYLLEVAEMTPSHVAIVLFTGKAWNAVSDPTCGYLVQRTHTRWGKMRPWILFSAPFACAFYFLLFYVPGGFSDTIVGKKAETEMSLEGKMGYYVVVFCLFTGLLSCLHVPYTALTMYVTNKQEERDSITAYRMWFEAIGILASIVTQGQLVSDTRCTGEEDDKGKIFDAHDMTKQGWSYMTGSFIVIGVYLICSLAVFFGVKEKESETEQKDGTGFFTGLKLVLTYGPYFKAATVYLFLWLAVATVEGNLVLYYTHSLKMGDKTSIFLIASLATCVGVMPGWQYASVRFGKKTAYAAGLITLMSAIFTTMYIPEKNFALTMIIMILAGVGCSAAILLPWSVLPDILDSFMLEKKMRKDAVFYAFYVFFNKLATGLALALSQMALALGGYKTGECTQPDAVGTTLRYLITPAPVVFLLIALGALYFYPINESWRQQIKQDVMLYHEKVQPRLTTSQSVKNYESFSVPKQPLEDKNSTTL